VIYAPVQSKLRINISRAAAIWGVTGDIFKGALLVAAWAYFWWGWGLDGISTFQTFPKRIHVSCLRCLWFFNHNFTIYSVELIELF
jgi:hypothetical protein